MTRVPINWVERLRQINIEMRQAAYLKFREKQRKAVSDEQHAWYEYQCTCEELGFETREQK